MEVPATYLVTAVAGGLDVVVEGRPGRHRLFEPVYTDAFIAGDTVLRPVRGADGAITGIRLSDDRVWNMPFTRLP